MAEQGAFELSAKTERRLEAATLQFEIGTLEFLLDQAPDDLEVLAELGERYTKAGAYEQGLSVDLKLARLAPENPVAHYNLACSYALLERLDEAFQALDRAITRGYRDLSHMELDPDLDALRRDPRYASLRARLGGAEGP